MARKSLIYLDNNSTTELSQDVAGLLTDLVVHNIYGNPSSKHEIGARARALVETSRYGVATSLGCEPSEIFFTSGGTESNNLALKSTYSRLDDKNSLVISAGEHSSVYNTSLFLAGEDNLRLIPLTVNGDLDLEWADRLINEDTSVVSVMLVNNETGAIFAVQEIAKMAHKRGALVHCDAVQAYGKIKIDVNSLGVDLLSISGHKAHALPGSGALFVRNGLLVHPTIHGGSQEQSIRPGTENYYGIASLGVIANAISKGDIGPDAGLRDIFELGLKNRIKDISINAEKVERVSNTTSVTFRGVHSSAMLTALEEYNICASAGSACSSGLTKPSRTLKSMGLNDEDALSTIRFSLSKLTTMSDISSALEACVKSVVALRKGLLEP